MYLNLKHENIGDTHKRHIYTFIIVLAIALFSIGLAVLPFARTRISIADQNGDSAVSERVRLLNVSRETFLAHKVLGAGMHTLVVNMPQDGLYSWQFQPTHNIYWLILAENGIIGALAFIGLILFVLLNSIKQIFTGVSSKNILLVFGSVGILAYLLIGLFDHHPWDIQQSQLTWWLLVGLVVSHI
jgi:O-antigen ligase